MPDGYDDAGLTLRDQVLPHSRKTHGEKDNILCDFAVLPLHLIRCILDKSKLV